MERIPKTAGDVANLLKLSELLSSNLRTVIHEWGQEQDPKAEADGGSPTIIPSRKLHDAQRTILAITGSLTELVSEPSLRILEVGCQYWESRALYIAAERRIPDMLADAGDAGLPIGELSAKTGIEEFKLSRILRCLCSNHVFAEPKADHFANNRISAALAHNDPLRAYILNFNLDLYAASEHMPGVLLDPKKGPSYRVDETAFQEALNTTKTRWDWLEEKVLAPEKAPGGAGYPGVPSSERRVNGIYIDSAPRSDAAAKTNGDVPSEQGYSRPEHEIFNLSMVGGGRVHGAAHPFDYPWDTLGEATVVDVGGGMGGFDIQLSHLYPKLKFVIQDRQPVLKMAEEVVWPRENPAALSQNRVQFMPHDFFQANPVQNADVYWLRSILHDWSDEYCVKILSNIRAAMTTPNSRILICDQLMNTTLGSPEIQSAPSPLPANYGYSVRFSHQRDLCMMGIINGIERTPAQLKKIVEESGLKIEKVWECRSQVAIAELRPVM